MIVLTGTVKYDFKFPVDCGFNRLKRTDLTYWAIVPKSQDSINCYGMLGNVIWDQQEHCGGSSDIFTSTSPKTLHLWTQFYLCGVFYRWNSDLSFYAFFFSTSSREVYISKIYLHWENLKELRFGNLIGNTGWEFSFIWLRSFYRGVQCYC